MENEIQCKVTKSTTVLIRANNASVDLNEPLYAINWFSTKVEWLYHFYNFLASKSVVKIGGRAFFKAKVTKTVLDQSDAKRSLILIVRYPGGANFKALMESTYFKFVSLFRMLAVKDFTFGFTHKHTIEDNSSVKDNFAYAVHHFKSDAANEQLFSKFQNMLTEGVRIKYAGGMVAQLMTQSDGGTPKAIRNLMDGIVIYEAEKETELEQMIETSTYRSFAQELNSSYIGYLKRVL